MDNFDFTKFYSSLLVIAIVISLGFFLGKVKWVDRNMNKKLVNLLLSVFMPASLLMAFPNEFQTEYTYLFLWGLVGGFATMISAILISKLIYNKKFFPGDMSYYGQFAFIFNNATFLGFPLINMAFGFRGVIPYCGFIIAFNLALFSYGVWIFERKVTLKFIIRVITNPNVIAVLLGMIMFLSGFSFNQENNIIHKTIYSSIQYISGATTPLSLICVGFMLSNTKIKALLKEWKLLIISIIQLVLAPIMTFIIIKVLLHAPNEVVLICTLIQALPTATSLGLFAEKYGGNVTEASQLVVVSTLMSIVTMPTIMTILFTTFG